MQSKACFKCGEVKQLTECYRHAMMRDGHLNKCKSCTKSDVRAHRDANHEKISEYERKRFQDPERRKRIAQSLANRKIRCPEKHYAHRAVSAAIKKGTLVREPCEICGTTVRVQAHHDDYSKPLSVRWLCFVHHREYGHGQRVSERMKAKPCSTSISTSPTIP